MCTASGKRSKLPEFLSHYYEAEIGPFVNLSDLPDNEAEACLNRICSEGEIFASQRAADYLAIRRELESSIRQRFVEIGWKPKRKRPHYMILGSSPWLLEWYRDGKEIRIPLRDFDTDSVSFTYGDTFPAMRCRDGKSYRGMVFRLNELSDLVLQFGMPQDWNPDGSLGPDRYIEAQIWDDAPLKAYLQTKAC